MILVIAAPGPETDIDRREPLTTIRSTDCLAADFFSNLSTSIQTVGAIAIAVRKAPAIIFGTTRFPFPREATCDSVLLTRSVCFGNEGN